MRTGALRVDLSELLRFLFFGFFARNPTLLRSNSLQFDFSDKNGVDFTYDLWYNVNNSF